MSVELIDIVRRIINFVKAHFVEKKNVDEWKIRFLRSWRPFSTRQVFFSQKMCKKCIKSCMKYPLQLLMLIGTRWDYFNLHLTQGITKFIRIHIGIESTPSHSILKAINGYQYILNAKTKHTKTSQMLLSESHECLCTHKQTQQTWKYIAEIRMLVATDSKV